MESDNPCKSTPSVNNPIAAILKAIELFHDFACFVGGKMILTALLGGGKWYHLSIVMKTTLSQDTAFLKANPLLSLLQACRISDAHGISLASNYFGSPLIALINSSKRLLNKNICVTW